MWIWWVTGIAAAYFAVWLGISLKLYQGAGCRVPGRPAEEKLQSWKKRHRWNVALLEQGLAWYRKQAVETVHLTSYDGLDLVADYLPAEGESRGRVILLHGYHGGLEDFSAILPFYHQLGYDLLVPDQRAHNRSGGKYICFGLAERRDCRDWAVEADRRWGERSTFLAGVSMGASTVLMSTGEALPRDVRGVIADCGYTTPQEVMEHVMRDFMHFPSLFVYFPLYPMEEVLFRLRTGYWIGSYSALKAMERNKLPVFFAHGEADKFVPMEMTQRNWAACQAEKELLLVPGAGHCQAYLFDTAGYQEKLEAFLTQHSGEESQEGAGCPTGDGVGLRKQVR